MAVSLSMTVSQRDVSIEGRGPGHEVDVWSMLDVDISKFCLSGNFYCKYSDLRKVSIS